MGVSAVDEAGAGVVELGGVYGSAGTDYDTASGGSGYGTEAAADYLSLAAASIVGDDAVYAVVSYGAAVTSSYESAGSAYAVSAAVY